jgi:glutamate racemase
MLGIFDSGIGGLTVVKELLRRAPNASFMYLGDTARTPYGTKGEETIIRYALEDADSLISHGATAIIVACNTVSAYAMPALRKQYPSVQFFDVLQPSIQVTSNTSKGHTGIIGTSATIRSGAYEYALKKVRPDLLVTSVACPLFVPLVEEGWLDDEVTRMVVERYLNPLKEACVDTIVLGCTHYPLLQPLIEEFMGRDVVIVDSPKAVLDQLEKEHAELLNKEGSQYYWFSDIQPSTASIASRWLNRDIEIKKGTFKNSL